MRGFDSARGPDRSVIICGNCRGHVSFLVTDKPVECPKCRVVVWTPPARKEPELSPADRRFLRSLRIAFWLTLLSVSIASGQALPVDKLTPPASSSSVRTAADVGSWGTVLTGIALDGVATWQAEDRKAAALEQGARLGITAASTWAIKFAVGRTRPCAPACGGSHVDTSFWSGHTAQACAAIGNRRTAWSIGLAAATAAGRIIAGKHWLTDTLAGCGAGLVIGRIR